MNPDFRRWSGYLAALLLGRSVAAHLVRGALGASAFVWAASNLSSHPAGALVAVAGALILLRGCPLCWLVSLIGIVSQRGGSAQRW